MKTSTILDGTLSVLRPSLRMQYLMPGLVRLVLEHSDEYVDQFLFHLGQSYRLAALTPAQASALKNVLETLALEEPEAVYNNAAAAHLEMR